MLSALHDATFVAVLRSSQLIGCLRSRGVSLSLPSRAVHCIERIADGRGSERERGKESAAIGSMHDRRSRGSCHCMQPAEKRQSRNHGNTASSLSAIVICSRMFCFCTVLCFVLSRSRNHRVQRPFVVVCSWMVSLT